MPNHVAIIFCRHIEDEEETVPKPISAKRTRGARTTKKRQPAAKRQKTLTLKDLSFFECR